MEKIVIKFARVELASTAVRRSFEAFLILHKEDRYKLLLITLVQIALGFLDLLAIALVGLLGALSITGIQSKNPNSKVQQVIEFLNIDQLSFQNQVAVLGFTAASVLIGRSVLTFYFSRKILYFLSKCSAYVSKSLIEGVLRLNLTEIQGQSAQQILFSITTGVNVLILNVLGAMAGLLTDFFLLTFLTVGLFALNPLMAVTTFGLFGLVGLVLYLSTHKRALNLGEQSAELNIDSNMRILELISSYREIYVTSRQEYYVNKLGESRKDLAQNVADLAFLPSIGKYVIEIALVVIGIVLCAIEFISSDATHAIAVLSVFLTAATRIAPAVLRIQTGLVTIKSNLAISERTLNLYNKFINQNSLQKPNSSHEPRISIFEPRIEIKDLSFKYPGSESPTINNVSLSIEPGTVTALVGPSGGGKSTLADLILGLRAPSAGEIKISGMNSNLAVKRWSGEIGYVPQTVYLSSTSLLENIALGIDPHEVDINALNSAIKKSQLEDFVRNSADGVRTLLRSDGSNLSGGQKQRIGLARALYSNPKLLILDEATSALDGRTESAITDVLFNLRGEVTVVIIAHRLSTIVNADQVILIENGSVQASGTFHEIREASKDFAELTKLMHLSED
jgi:ABC-type multidrug transport system fused ATPase/permease subunit